MIVTEQNYKRIHVEVDESSKTKAAEEYIRNQYKLSENTQVFWIVSSTHYPFSTKPSTHEWSASIDIDLT